MSDQTAHREGFAEVDGARIYYQEAGSGFPLVLIHAGVADHTMWDEQFDLFAQRYRVVRYDQRGFGKSKMPAGTFRFIDDLKGVLDHLGIERAYVAGVSIGGSTTINFALTYPERVAAIIPAACGIPGAPGDGSLDALFEPMNAAYEAKDLEKVLEEELRIWLVGPDRSPDAVSDELKEHFRRMERHNLAMEFAGEEGTPQPIKPTAAERLHEIQVPMLYIAGDADLPNVPAAAAIFREQVPGAEAVVLHNVAHMIPMEAPAEFNRLALDFLARCDAKREA